MKNKISKATLELLKAGRAIHFNHYGKQLPYACIRAQGIQQTLVRLEEPNAGEKINVLDVSGGYGSACLGAAPPAMQEAFHLAIHNDGYVTDELGSLSRARLLNKLLGKNGLWCDHFPEGEYQVSGRNSGSEGLELALRMAYESRFDYRYQRPVVGKEHRNIILAFEGAWHGWTSGLIPLLNRRHFRVGLPEFEHENKYGVKFDFLPFAELSALEEYFKKNGDQILTVVVEPIQGDAGIIVPPEGYLRKLSDLCRVNNVVLIADEVLTFAKTGEFFAMRDREGPIYTDISVIGKNLGMGVIPVSMVIAKKELTVRVCGAIATCDLRPITCQIIEKGIDYILHHHLLEKSKLHGDQLQQQLAVLVENFPEIYAEMRGIGGVYGIELTEKASHKLLELRTIMIENGVYLEFMAGAGKRSKNARYLFPTMRVAPPLIASDAEIQEIIRRIKRASQAFAKLLHVESFKSAA
jgi:ornithine--oxo-acid transaminase